MDSALVINPTMARNVVNFGMLRPAFTMAWASKVSGVSVDTIRNLKKHGVITLHYMKSEGHGIPVLLAFRDVVEIMAVAELYNIGISPKTLGNVFEVISEFVLGQILSSSEINKNVATSNNYQRFVIIYFHDKEKKVLASIETEPFPAALAKYSTLVVVDCLKLATNALFSFANYKE